MSRDSGLFFLIVLTPTTKSHLKYSHFEYEEIDLGEIKW